MEDSIFEARKVSTGEQFADMWESMTYENPYFPDTSGYGIEYKIGILVEAFRDETLYQLYSDIPEECYCVMDETEVVLVWTICRFRRLGKASELLKIMGAKTVQKDRYMPENTIEFWEKCGISVVN